MTTQEQLDFLLRVMRCFNDFEGPSPDWLWWRTDEEYAPFTLFVKCSDTFGNGADLEPLTPENIAEMERAVADCAVDPVGSAYAPELFCARMRKMRPMRAAYPREPKLAALFDACGQVREG